ncbi:hypothetical protein Syun_023649 [Stephania yunnanensis]|uniref:Uncharacterized protein n=1 Tax=Stephania yunnanensis TaxID=152371 RepID=A0AAP0HZT6_9MAGN
MRVGVRGKGGRGHESGNKEGGVRYLRREGEHAGERERREEEGEDGCATLSWRRDHGQWYVEEAEEGAATTKEISSTRGRTAPQAAEEGGIDGSGTRRWRQNSGPGSGGGISAATEEEGAVAAAATSGQRSREWKEEKEELIEVIGVAPKATPPVTAAGVATGRSAFVPPASRGVPQGRHRQRLRGEISYFPHVVDDPGALLLVRSTMWEPESLGDETSDEDDVISIIETQGEEEYSSAASIGGMDGDGEADMEKENEDRL